jgi:hypothetical protein
VSLQDMCLQVASHAKHFITTVNCARKRFLVGMSPDMVMEMMPSCERSVLATRKFANQLCVHSFRLLVVKPLNHELFGSGLH